jgi:hypothetical protein
MNRKRCHYFQHACISVKPIFCDFFLDILGSVAMLASMSFFGNVRSRLAGGSSVPDPGWTPCIENLLAMRHVMMIETYKYQL